MNYNIELINNLNIDFIVIIFTAMQSPTRNAAGILVLNSDPDSYFFPSCAQQAQKWFLIDLKIKSPQQANPVKLLRNAVVYYILIEYKDSLWIKSYVWLD